MNNMMNHYDLLIDENNDPVHDPEPLREYMDRWDGEAFIRVLELSQEKTALEIGIGTGRIALRTAPLCNRLYGIDLSSKTCARVKKNLSEYRNVTLVCANFLDYNFNRKFDVIYSTLTFMHIADKQRAINKVSSLLNHNGKFILSIDKNQSEYIECGNRKIKVYPDNPENIICCIHNAGLIFEENIETEAAYIVTAKKQNTAYLAMLGIH